MSAPDVSADELAGDERRAMRRRHSSAVAVPRRGRPAQWGALALIGVGGVAAGLALGAMELSTDPVVAVLVLGLLAAIAAAIVRPLWACALVFATAAVGNRELPGAPLGLQVVHGVCVLAVGAVVFAVIAGAPADRIRRPELRLPLLFSTGFVLVAAISTALSVSQEKSVKVTATLTTGLLLAAAVILVARTGRALRLLVAVTVIGSSFVTLPALAGAGQLTAVYGGAVVKNRPTGAFTDPNELGSYSAIAFLLALGWLLASQRRAERVFAVVAALGALAALSLSLSRGAWLGAALGVAVLVAMHPRARRPVGWAAVACAAAGLAGALALPASGPAHVVLDRITSVGDPSGNPYDVRPITWREALREFSAAPAFGNGPGSFSVLSGQSPSELQFYPRLHAHNGLLTIAAEMGAAGAIAAIGLAVTLALAVRARARRLRATHRYADLGLLAGGAAALGALAGHLLVDYPLRNPTLMVTVWAVLGLVLAATAIPAAPSAVIASNDPVAPR